jgi:hypothetical protein
LGDVASGGASSTHLDGPKRRESCSRPALETLEHLHPVLGYLDEMSRARCRTALAMGLCAAGLLIAACGGDSRSGTGEVVARIDHHAITRTMLSQWMRERTGQFFYEIAKREAPADLTAEPADYPACVASLRAVAPIPGPRPSRPPPNASDLMKKCIAIHRSFKIDALLYLISSYSTLDFAISHGIDTGEAEVQRKLKQIKIEHQQANGRFEGFLASQTRTLSQELFMIRIELLRQKLQDELRTGSPRLVREITTAATHARCRPGYMVVYCVGYKRPMSEAAIDGSVLLEEIAKWRPHLSH